MQPSRRISICSIVRSRTRPRLMPTKPFSRRSMLWSVGRRPASIASARSRSRVPASRRHEEGGRSAQPRLRRGAPARALRAAPGRRCRARAGAPRRRRGARRTWRQRAGCARAATVIGPLEWAPITAVAHETPVEGATQPLAASYKGIAPFVDKVAPMTVSADGCEIGLLTTSVLEGLRAVVVDVDVPAAQTIGVALESPSAAVLIVGGKVALTRGYDLGGGRVAEVGHCGRRPGRVRVGRARRQQRRGIPRGAPCSSAEDGPRSLRELPSRATPPPWRRPAPRSSSFAPIEPPTPSERSSRPLGSRKATRAPPSTFSRRVRGRRTRAPIVALLYARAIDEAADLPENRAIERERDALRDNAQSLAHRMGSNSRPRPAHRAAARRGRGAHRRRCAKSPKRKRRAHRRSTPMVTAASRRPRAAEGKLFDVSESRLCRRSRKRLGHAPQHAPRGRARRRRARPRRRRARAVRLPHTGRRSNSLDCLTPKSRRGDRRGALAEIARLRALRDSPSALRQLELTQYVALGDEAGMLRVYDAMLPAERTRRRARPLATRSARQLKSRTACCDLLTAADVPGSLGPLSTSLYDSPAQALEAEGAELVAADRKSRSLSNAATAVLKHTERYVIGDGGPASLHALRSAPRLGHHRRRAGRPGGRRARSKGAMYAASCAGASTSPTGVCSSPTRHRTPRRSTPISRSSRRATTSSKSSRAGRCPAHRGSWSSTRPISCPSAPACSRRASSSGAPRRSSCRSGRTRSGASRPSASTAAKRSPLSRMKDRPPRRLEEGRAQDGPRRRGELRHLELEAHGSSRSPKPSPSLEDRDPFVSQWARTAAARRRGNADTSRPPSPTITRAIVDRIATAAGKAVKVASGAVLSDSAASLSGAERRPRPRAPSSSSDRAAAPGSPTALCASAGSQPRSSSPSESPSRPIRTFRRTSVASTTRSCSPTLKERRRVARSRRAGAAAPRGTREPRAPRAAWP